LIAGVIVCLGVLFNERTLKVDDPCGAISVFKLINAIYPMRVSAEAELEGLDVPQFGMLAYPEAGTKRVPRFS